MSTAELKDHRPTHSEERKWIAVYLLDEMFAVPELRQTAPEMAELTSRREQLRAGPERVTQPQAESHWTAR